MRNNKWYIKDRISDEYFIKVCNESKTMKLASCILKIHFNSFKKRAIKLGCYNPIDRGGKNYSNSKIDIYDILNGDYPSYNTHRLKIRLINEKILENKCCICGINEWNGKILNCELDHIDGDRTNHKLNNLRILCPNCHSQTDTFRSKNKFYKKYKPIKNKIKILKNKCECGVLISDNASMCKDCYFKSIRKIINRPTYESLLNDIKELDYRNTGKKYGVSDNTIRKWIKNYEKKREPIAIRNNRGSSRQHCLKQENNIRLYC